MVVVPPVRTPLTLLKMLCPKPYASPTTDLPSLISGSADSSMLRLYDFAVALTSSVNEACGSSSRSG